MMCFYSPIAMRCRCAQYWCLCMLKFLLFSSLLLYTMFIYLRYVFTSKPVYACDHVLKGLPGNSKKSILSHSHHSTQNKVLTYMRIVHVLPRSIMSVCLFLCNQYGRYLF